MAHHIIMMDILVITSIMGGIIIHIFIMIIGISYHIGMHFAQDIDHIFIIDVVILC